jgi:hypothetical protein
MEEDNVYPNDSSQYFMPREPAEQIIERKKEKAQTLEALNEFRAIVNRLEERIRFYESVANIPDEIRTKPDEFLIMHNTHTLMVRTLTSEKEYIEGLLNAHIRSL